MPMTSLIYNYENDISAFPTYYEKYKFIALEFPAWLI